MTEQITYSYEAHKPIKRKGITYMVCAYCGLIYLRNEFTNWSIRMGCNSRYHRDYDKVKYKFTKID